MSLWHDLLLLGVGFVTGAATMLALLRMRDRHAREVAREGRALRLAGRTGAGAMRQGRRWQARDRGDLSLM